MNQTATLSRSLMSTVCIWAGYTASMASRLPATKTALSSRAQLPDTFAVTVSSQFLGISKLFGERKWLLWK